MKAIIYKYLDEKGAIETIKNNSVILRTPIEYNDPFDCVISTTEKEKNQALELLINYQMFKGLFDAFNKVSTSSTKLKFIAMMLKKELDVIAKSTKTHKKYTLQPALLPYRVQVLKYLNKNKKTLSLEFDKAMEEAFIKMRSGVIISCFGSSYDSILMWSHYANKHKGACIEYEINDKDFFPVVYSQNMPKYQLNKTFEVMFGHQFINKEVEDNDDRYYFTFEPLLIKSNVWQYEGEIRCVYSYKKRNPKIYEAQDEKGNAILLLKMPKMKRIFLGCNAENDFIQTVKELAYDVPIVKMKMKENEYGIEPKE